MGLSTIAKTISISQDACDVSMPITDGATRAIGYSQTGHMKPQRLSARGGEGGWGEIDRGQPRENGAQVDNHK